METQPGPDERRLRELLASPHPPADLSARVRANLDEAAVARPRRYARHLLFAAVAAGLAAILLLVGPLPSAVPPVVAAAYDDMVRDRALFGIRSRDAGSGGAGGMAAGGRAIVDLTKDCLLQNYVTRHVRLRVPGLGRINVFVYTGPDWRLFTRVPEGQVKDQRWLAMAGDADRAVLVLYEREADRGEVVSVVRNALSTGLTG